MVVTIGIINYDGEARDNSLLVLVIIVLVNAVEAKE